MKLYREHKQGQQDPGGMSLEVTWSLGSLSAFSTNDGEVPGSAYSLLATPRGAGVELVDKMRTEISLRFAGKQAESGAVMEQQHLLSSGIN